MEQVSLFKRAKKKHKEEEKTEKNRRREKTCSSFARCPFLSSLSILFFFPLPYSQTTFWIQTKGLFLVFYLWQDADCLGFELAALCTYIPHGGKEMLMGKKDQGTRNG